MATLQKRKGNRLSRFFSLSESSLPSNNTDNKLHKQNPERVTADDANNRRAVSHNPQTLPDRTAPSTASQNAPWIPPPQQHARSSSAQIAKNGLLTPLAPPAEIHRRAVGGGTPSSATTSPVGSRPNSGYSSQPSSPYRNQLAPQTSLSVPGGGLSPAASPEKAVNKRKSWFGGGGQKLSKPGKGDVKEEKPAAWIVGFEGKPAYDTAPLLSAQQVWTIHS